MILPSSELSARYRTRAPRYTSYPAAPHFGPLPEAALDTALAQCGGPLSLYVHIPFCTHLCLYCGCHVEIRESRSVADPYIDSLLQELDLWTARVPETARFCGQICLGGGTPTFLRADQMRRLVQGLQSRLAWTPDVDASIEIDPRSVDEEALENLVSLGFNRYSFGVQDFDEEVLKKVARPQTEAQVRLCTSVIRRASPSSNLNFDLMYGLPGQDEERFARTLSKVIELRPTRIALFHYAHVPWMKPAQKVLEKRGMPETDLKTRLYALATETLVQAGYAVIGMDHFALPGDELIVAQKANDLQRNFMGYTTRANLDQLGIGVSSIGSFSGVYAQNYKDRDTWSSCIATGNLPVERGRVLTAEDHLRRRVIMRLFCNFSLHLDRAEAEHLAPELERLIPLVEDALLHIHRDAGGTHLELTSLGRHFIRNVCAVFDQYLEIDQGQRRYSMTA